MMSSKENEIRIARKLHEKSGQQIIVMNSDRRGVYNTFSAEHREMFEAHGYICVYDTREFKEPAKRMSGQIDLCKQDQNKQEILALIPRLSQVNSNR